jgi:hypothetical protein
MIARFLAFGIPSWLAYLLALGAVIGAIYAKGRIDAAHVAEIATLKLEIDQEREANRKLKEYIARLEKAATEDAEEKAKDDAEITDLKTRLTELVDTASDPDRECFGADDIDRLRGGWKDKGRSGNHPRRRGPG